MGFGKKYRSLFSVEILHHYFLDEGEEVYDDDLDEDKMKKNLAAYNLSDFMSIKPTQKTLNTLKNFRARFIQSNLGFNVAMAASTDEDSLNEPFIPFSEDLSFDFVVKIKDQFFENYTDIIINREEPLFLSNVEPAEAVDPEEGEEKTAIPVRFCPLSKFDTTLINVDSLTPPMAKLEIELEEIQSGELVGAFAVIRIHLNGDDDEITLTDEEEGGVPGSKEFNRVLPVVKLILKNRLTIWKYHNSADSVQVHETGELPLTKHGYITVEDSIDNTIRYPNPSARMIYDAEIDDPYKDKDGIDVVEDDTKKYSRTFI